MQILQFPCFFQLETVALWSLCDLMRQVCDAVLYLHDNQLVHCCISSHSIHLVLPTLAKLGNLEYMVQKWVTYSQLK